jgi:hypothetical protein
MIFLTSIAHFYQKKFRTHIFLYIYIVPIIVLIVPVMQLFPIFSFQAESIELLGSFSSFFASYFLYMKMVGLK